MALLVTIVICLYVVNRTFLLDKIPKWPKIYVLTLPSLAGFCEVLNMLVDVKCHICE